MYFYKDVACFGIFKYSLIQALANEVKVHLVALLSVTPVHG